MSGLELPRELDRRGHNIPIIFITALEDDTVRDRVLSQGAVECLFKPFREADLIKALDSAIPVNNTKSEREP